MLRNIYKYTFEKELSSDLQNKSVNLKAKLDNYRDDVKIFSTNSNLAQTLLWLFEKQKENGSWGNNNVASTAITMLAIKSIEQPAIIWGYKDELTNAIKKAENFLINSFSNDKYENALWDISVATKALIVCCPGSREFINSELIPILLQYKSEQLNAGPHHLAQRILALKEFGVQKKILVDSITELNFFLTNNNWEKYSPYIISQCLEALSSIHNDLNLKEYVEYLLNWLQNNSLDSANFVNVCSTLISLKQNINLELEKKLKYTVSSLFGTHCFRYDGSWYFDEYITSYAILALAKYEKEILIRAPRIEFNYEINTFVDDVLKAFQQYSKNENINWLLHLLSMLIGSVLLTSFIVYTALDNEISQWLEWLLPSLGTFLILFPISELIRRFIKFNNNIK